MAARQVTMTALRIGIGTLFIYAGGIKVFDPQQFALDVQHYELTAWSAAVVVAVYLPWLEILAGGALITRRLPLGATLALLGMSTVFLAAIASAWARGLDISCGCFGREAGAIKTNFPLLIGRDVALLAAILVLLANEWRAARTPV